MRGLSTPAVAITVALMLLTGCSSPPPVRPVNLALKSAIAVDLTANAVVLPIERGLSQGKSVWFIVTDSSESADAETRRVVHAPEMQYVTVVQTVRRENGLLVFPGAPDFSAARIFRPGPQGFPPAAAEPGAVAGDGYSPFIRIEGQSAILNAPIIATGDGPFDVIGHGNTADRVLAIDTKARTATLLLSRGFAEGRAVSYISTEASDPGVAAIERAVYMPSLGKSSGEIALLVIANGQTGRGNPQAQGMAFASLEGGLERTATLSNSATMLAPGNILVAIPSGPTAPAYSPLWSVSMALWSPAAVTDGRVRRLTGQTEVYQASQAKLLTGPNGGPVGPVGVLVNCPVIAYHD